MNKFVRSFITVCVLSSVVFSILGFKPNMADAQIRLRFGGQTVTISHESSALTLLNAIEAVRKGKASLVIPSSQIKKAKFSLKLGTARISVRKNRLPVRGNQVKLTGTLNTKDLTDNLIEALTNILSGITEQQTNSSSNPNIIRVAKPYWLTHCEEADTPVEELDRDLIKRGVTIYERQCASPDGINTIQQCGTRIQMYRVLQIDASNVIWAVLAGFTPVDRMSQSLSIVSCSPSVNDTIEMVGVITNIACKTTQNTTESFDERLKNAGLNILEASCSAEDKVACGEVSNLYRLVKIKRSQRGLAIALGLKDRRNFGGEVKFGLACPPPLVVDEDFSETIEMVGILFYKTCPITENLVEDFDNRMVNGGLTMLFSSCGLYGAPPVGSACPVYLRLVRIPKNQESLGVMLGLYYKHELAFPIIYGQSCPR